MTIIELTPSVYIHQDDSYYLVNSCCVILDSELIFIDTGLNDDVAEEFVSKMKNKTGIKDIKLVITHAHGDHISGIKPFEGCHIIVSKYFPASLNENMKRFRWGEERMKYYNSFSLDIMEEQKVIGEGDYKIIFKQIGGHSPDSIYGYFPKDKVLFAGDNLLSKMPQYFPFDNTNLDDWIRGLKEWEKMDIDWVVVGHGDVVKKDHITRVREFFEELVDFLEYSASEKLSIEQVLSHADCPSYFEEDPENWTSTGIEAYYERMIK
jgi:glyoxylase-like metal-dependent hydrolase (beta-lactamase superfamily II)